MIMLDLLKENNKIPKQKIIFTDIIEVNRYNWFIFDSF